MFSPEDWFYFALLWRRSDAGFVHGMRDLPSGGHCCVMVPSGQHES